MGVRYEPVGLPPSPGVSRLRIALALEGAPADVFDTVSRTEAATIRGKEWKNLSAVKPTHLSSLRYVFTFTCENGKSFMNPLNRRWQRIVVDKSRYHSLTGVLSVNAWLQQLQESMKFLGYILLG